MNDDISMEQCMEINSSFIMVILVFFSAGSDDLFGRGIDGLFSRGSDGLLVSEGLRRQFNIAKRRLEGATGMLNFRVIYQCIYFRHIRISAKYWLFIN